MSYYIEYGPAIPPRYIKKPRTARLQILTATWLLVFFFLVRAFFPSGAAYLRETLLPDAPTVTQEALEDLMSDLRNGEPLEDAFAAFCTYIIDRDEMLPH